MAEKMCGGAGFFRPWKGEVEIEASVMNVDETTKIIAQDERSEKCGKPRDSDGDDDDDDEDTNSVDSSWSECCRTSEDSRSQYQTEDTSRTVERRRRRRRRSSRCSSGSIGSCDDPAANGSLYGFSSFELDANNLNGPAHTNNNLCRKRTNDENSPSEISSTNSSSSSSCDSPRSAFTPTSYRFVYPSFDYQAPFLIDPLMPSWSQRHNADQINLLYGLAAVPIGGYPNSVEEAVKYIHQQDAAAKQMKKLRPKKFRCVHCDVAFSNNGQLKGHIRIHTGERPFKCEIDGCNKAFTRNEELTRHRKIHTGLKPHSCEICGKSFGRKDHLKKHQRTHQNRGIPAHFGATMFGYIEHPVHYQQSLPSAPPVPPYHYHPL